MYMYRLANLQVISFWEFYLNFVVELLLEESDLISVKAFLSC